MKFTHQYIGESYGSQPFLLHEKSLPEIKLELEEAGMDTGDFCIGNTELFSAVEVDLDEGVVVWESECGKKNVEVDLKFDEDGIYTYKQTTKFIAAVDKWNDVIGVNPQG